MAKQIEGKEIPIRWVDNPNRIVSLFTTVHGRKIRVHSIGMVFEVMANRNDDIEALRKKIGNALAGMPVGMTETMLSAVL